MAFRYILPIAASFLLVASGPASSAAVAPPIASETVTALAALIEKEYFDPAQAKRIATTLREGFAKGLFKPTSSAFDLAKLITSELLLASHDQHLALIARENASPGSLSSPISREVAGARDNFGVHRVEVLPGNVGYLDFRAFWRPSEASATLAAAMATLAHADAVILDLRQNHGGNTGALALVASYLVDSPGKALFEIAPRPPASPITFHTEPQPLPGRIGDRPLFILTSPATFSAGEGLAFLMQERHRAQVIGEPTPGGANQTKSFMVNDQFEARICNATWRSVLTGKNWEGTGVRPDIKVAAGDALTVAHGRALDALLKEAPLGPWREALLDAKAALKAIPSHP